MPISSALVFLDDLPCTHSLDRLLWDQWVTHDYWERHEIPSKSRPAAPRVAGSRLRALSSSLLAPDGDPWVTVRDAISDCPIHAPKTPTWLRTTGSIPARAAIRATLAVRGTGPPRRSKQAITEYPAERTRSDIRTVASATSRSGKRHGCRHFRIASSSTESWTETMRQLGNAVPVDLAYKVADSVAKALRRAASSDTTQTPQTAHA